MTRSWLLIATLAVGVASCGRGDKGATAHHQENEAPRRADSGTAATESGSNAPNASDVSCNGMTSQQYDATNMRPYEVSAEVAAKVDITLQAMDASQRAAQMMGTDGSKRNYQDMMRSADVEVPGVGTIRGFRFRYGGRGANLDDGQDNREDDGKEFSTVFPSESLRAAAWDIDLERRIGAAVGDETATSYNNALLAPTADLLRHPYWGRALDSYGEDAYLVGRLATAFAVGAQQYVMACAKHFAAYTVEKGRANHDAVVSEQTLREHYLRPFEMVVQDAGVGCTMAAYNLVNGTKMTQNRHLLTDILRGPPAQGGMGFEGIVVTDLWAMPGDQTPDAATIQADTNAAVLAGTDIEQPWSLHYTQATLAAADQTLVDAAARRILTQKFRFGSALATDPWSRQPPTSTLTASSITPNDSHIELAEQSAVESMVLLTNGLEPAAPVLPLVNMGSVAVVGANIEYALISSTLPKSCPQYFATEPPPGRTCPFDFASDPALGDRGSNRVNADPILALGPASGIRAVAKAAVVTAGSGREEVPLLTRNVELASTADAVVVVVGYTPGDEGEEFVLQHGGDRTSLTLRDEHTELVTAILDLGKPTVIVVETGSVVDLPWLTHANRNQATIWAGYSGQRGGQALGRLIFGQANFGGRLPMTWSTEATLLPFTDTPSSSTLGYYFGYREYDRRRYVAGEGAAPLFPFGHGLSYARFEYSALSVPCETAAEAAIVQVTVSVTNTSGVDGDEVVMLFVKPPARAAAVTGERPWKQLASFARVTVPAGQTVTAHLPLRLRDLRRWQGDADGSWVTDNGDYTLMVGANADSAEASPLRATLRVESE